MRKNEGLCWCVYYDHLLNHCYDFAKRREVIEKTKLPSEVPIWLYEMKFVKGKLPKKLILVYIRWRKVIAIWHKLSDKQKKLEIEEAELCDKFYKTVREHQPALEILHKKEVPDTCWDGKKLNFKKSKKE